MTLSEDAIRLADQLTLNDPILITSARLEEIIIDHTLDILNAQSLAKINSTPVVSEQLDYIDDAEAWSMGIVNQGPQMCVAYMIEIEGFEQASAKLSEFKQIVAAESLSETF